MFSVIENPPVSIWVEEEGAMVTPGDVEEGAARISQESRKRKEDHVDVCSPFGSASLRNS